MKNFYITFGYQYSYEKHPFFEDASPNGWLTIEAEDEDEARHLAFSYLGQAWAFIYNDDSLSEEYYPLGELARVSVLD